MIPIVAMHRGSDALVQPVPSATEQVYPVADEPAKVINSVHEYDDI